MKTGGCSAAVALVTLAIHAEANVTLMNLPFSDFYQCGDCHKSSAQLGVFVEPHGFVAKVVDICLTCHSKKHLGKSHPTGKRVTMDPLPADLPFEVWVSEYGEEYPVVTCGTCHNPHLPGIGIRYRPPPEPGMEGTFEPYRTRFLRKDAKNVTSGFAPLCKTCHAAK